MERIVDGVCLAIRDEFGDGYRIFTERVEQGLERPCFLVRCTGHSLERYLNRRFRQESQLEVRFFPGGAQEDCARAAEGLLRCLELIDWGEGPVRGSRLRAELEDGLLRVTVRYGLFVDLLPETEAMGELELQGEAF